jgi:uncharacterized protein (UPF0332 family)
VDLVDAFFLHAANLAASSKTGGCEQIDLRRAVSAAYYAVFHLLTMTAAENWAVPAERARFARLFEHGKMKQASKRLPAKIDERLGTVPSAQDVAIGDDLKTLSKEFTALQDDRHIADYDNSKVWSYTEVESIIIRARDLYTKWESVAKAPLAMAYLLDMLSQK